MNEVLVKYKQSTFLFSSVFILHLYFFLGSSLKAYFYWISRISNINEVYLKVVFATFLYTTVCFVFLNERTCETRKIVFYFTLKALFILEIIKF